MEPDSLARRMLEQEARALLTRLGRLRSFVLHETMVTAAALSVDAQNGIERELARGKRELRRKVHEFLRWLAGPEGRKATPVEAQRRFTLLRLRFNAVLSHFDIFSEAVSQRSESEIGVWLAGLDVVARDALALPGHFAAPPVVCYLARGPGAAIRRARTRLPGGGENPVAVIRMPRERMIGSALASSLVHEVGHQGAALLDLVLSLRTALRAHPAASARGLAGRAWALWSRWISEIIADFWSVAKVGITSTMGLIGVVSLPRAFVFRTNLDDPHPTPWIRVKLSSAIGKALFPHPQWDRVTALWESFYPRDGLDPERQALLAALEATMPTFVQLLVEHRPARLGRQCLAEVMATKERQPSRLSALFQAWSKQKSGMKSAPPTLVFAVLGQARADGGLSPEHESEWLAKLLTHWAMRDALDVSAACAAHLRRSDARITAAPPRYPAQAVY